MKKKTLVSYLSVVLIGLSCSIKVWSQTLQPNFYNSVDEYSALTIKFTDLSAPASQITAWSWNFGDGKPVSTQKNPTHVYTYAGDYVVKLTVNRGSEQGSISKTITVNYKTNFEWTEPAYLNREVIFTDKTLYPCPNGITRTWTFNNFSTSTAENPSFTFTSVGTFPVKLCATDNCGNSFCGTKNVKVIIPSNNLFPKFVTDWYGKVRKGQTLKFYDQSTPETEIKWWSWWFEQPSNLENEYPVQNGQGVTNYSRQEYVSHTYNRAGTFKARLYTGNMLNNGLPEGLGTFYDQLIQVTETPELTPSAAIPYLSDHYILDLAISNDLFAELDDYTSRQTIQIRKKGSGDNSSEWLSKEYYDSYQNGNYTTPVAKFYNLTMKNDKLMVMKKSVAAPATEPFSYQFFSNLGTANQFTFNNDNIIGSHLFSPTTILPHFDFYDQNVVVSQLEGTTNYIYVVKQGYFQGNKWSYSSIVKNLIVTDVAINPGKIFIDENTIVAHINGSIYIIEKVGFTWNFQNAKIISGDFVDIAYTANTIIACPRIVSPNYLTPNDRVAYVYEKPTTGWLNNMTPTGGFYLLSDTDISDNTKIRLNNVNTISMYDDYATLKVTLGSIDRTYIFKKKSSFWGPASQMYKINNVDEINHGTQNTLPSPTSNFDMLNGLNYGELEVYNYQNYCVLNPFVQTNFTINGTQNNDIVNGAITLGGGPGVINSGAVINYIGTSITLLPGVIAKSGSKVSFKSVSTCDDLYK